MRGILAPAGRIPGYDRIREILQGGKAVLVSGVGDGIREYLAAAVAADLSCPALVITANDVAAAGAYDNLCLYDPDGTVLFPAKDPVFYSAQARGGALEESRLRILRRIREGSCKTVVTTIDALFDRLMPPEVFYGAVIRRKVGEELPPEEAAERLTALGYEREDQITHAGQFAMRGGIIDVFPVSGDPAIRIELWGDEIDSIRLLDTETQRSGARILEFTIDPAREIFAGAALTERVRKEVQDDTERAAKAFLKSNKTEEYDRIRQMTESFLYRISGSGSYALDAYIPYYYPESANLLDYVPESTIVVLEEPARIREKARIFSQESAQNLQTRLEKGYILARQCGIYPEFEEIAAGLQRHPGLYVCGLIAANQQIFPIQELLSVSSHSINVLPSEREGFLKDLKRFTDEGYSCILLAESEYRVPGMIDFLTDEEIPVERQRDADQEPRPGVVTIMEGTLKQGFTCPAAKLLIAPQQENTAAKAKRKRRFRVKNAQKVGAFSDLTPGDYVVHETHGVGIYQGIVQLEQNGASHDFFKIQYRDSGVLYVPTTSLELLQRYVGGEDAKPKVNRLGGQEWNRTKNKVQESVSKLAEKLVRLYAARQGTVGYAFSPDTVWQREFEDSFPFEETDDQLAAIEDTKKDMESDRIMDRLICGDVGYGKTEIAIRAAFKAVQDNKQVAVLAPTTILAQQHFNTFSSRMHEYPVKIGILSRFSTPKQRKEALVGIADGSMDILIGTHRILSKDVRFKNLGLLVVDEEQRFGVTHKEKIKELQKSVDVLTLTATPIPRTLHMSLSGIRDMSVLEEPPEERQPVQTFVMEEDEDIIREAIYREIGRGGQVFFLSNRVQGIEEQLARLRKLVPEARMEAAHGQMQERELENVMMTFIQGEIDVLVCTTIIETGLDIPNANTILIMNADTMGLSQLYQLRGRVGRSSRLAYAYFMYSRDKVLNEAAEKRLEAIGEFTEFGSGFRIAMRDLEIRGAGNVLGAEQHGHMGAVGYDLYCKMLREAMDILKDEPVRPTFETTMKVRVDAYIPDSYISSGSQKLEVYKKIAAIAGEDDYLDMQEELLDRYSDMPACVGNLLDISFLKYLANGLGADSLEEDGFEMKLHFRTDAPIDYGKLAKILAPMSREARIIPKQDTVTVRIPFHTETVDKDSVRLTRIRKILERIAEARIEEVRPDNGVGSADAGTGAKSKEDSHAAG